MTRDEILLKAEKYFPAQSGEAVDDNGDVYSTDDVEWPTKVGFLYGYREAEKDLALTWEDIPKLIELTGKTFRTFSDAGRQDVSLQQLYEEVLRRFNEQRKK